MLGLWVLGIYNLDYIRKRYLLILSILIISVFIYIYIFPRQMEEYVHKTQTLVFEEFLFDASKPSVKDIK